jgi:putative nucleotidyltransferase with HDIG domain
MKFVTVGPIIGMDSAGELITLVARVYRDGRERVDGTTFVRARLTHSRGCWTGFFPAPTEVAAARIAPGQAIGLDARYLKHKFAQGGLRIERWEPLSLPAEQALGIDLLPSALCPYPFLVEMLAEMIDRLRIPALRDFLTRVLCDPKLRDGFLTAPASAAAHHNRPGGLIQHSMQVARLVASMAALSDKERELGVAAALVHDIGKLRIYGHADNHSHLGAMLHHDALTLEMLANPLLELERRWPDGALALRHLLAAAPERKSFSDRIEQRVGLVLRFADQWSSHNDKNCRAFRAANKRHGIAWFGRQRFWRPQPPAEIDNCTAPLVGSFDEAEDASR